MMPGTAAMTRDEIAHLFGRRLDALKRRDVEALACDYAEDAVVDSPVGSVRGRAGIEMLHRGWFSSFPDLTFDQSDLIIGDDRAVLVLTVGGTNTAASWTCRLRASVSVFTAVTLCTLRGRTDRARNARVRLHAVPY
jgi:ketosteroid isomerase-like protein